MTLSRSAAGTLYLLMAVLALCGTWAHNLAYLDLGFIGATAQFWQETLVNPASRSITVDLFFLTIAIALWMLLEARRIGLRYVWLYLIFCALVAISVTVPLFLWQRERLLAAREGGDAGRLATGDAVGFGILAVLTLAFTAHSFGV